MAYEAPRPSARRDVQAINVKIVAPEARYCVNFANVPLLTTIEVIKNRIASTIRSHPPPSALRLIHHGAPCHNTSTLMDLIKRQWGTETESCVMHLIVIGGDQNLPDSHSFPLDYSKSPMSPNLPLIPTDSAVAFGHTTNTTSAFSPTSSHISANTTNQAQAPPQLIDVFGNQVSTGSVNGVPSAPRNVRSPTTRVEGMFPGFTLDREQFSNLRPPQSINDGAFNTASPFTHPLNSPSLVPQTAPFPPQSTQPRSSGFYLLQSPTGDFNALLVTPEANMRPVALPPDIYQTLSQTHLPMEQVQTEFHQFLARVWIDTYFQQRLALHRQTAAINDAHVNSNQGVLDSLAHQRQPVHVRSPIHYQNPFPVPPNPQEHMHAQPNPQPPQAQAQPQPPLVADPQDPAIPRDPMVWVLQALPYAWLIMRSIAVLYFITAGGRALWRPAALAAVLAFIYGFQNGYFDPGNERMTQLRRYLEQLIGLDGFGQPGHGARLQPEVAFDPTVNSTNANPDPAYVRVFASPPVGQNAEERDTYLAQRMRLMHRELLRLQHHLDNSPPAAPESQQLLQDLEVVKDRIAQAGRELENSHDIRISDLLAHDQRHRTRSVNLHLGQQPPPSPSPSNNTIAHRRNSTRDRVAAMHNNTNNNSSVNGTTSTTTTTATSTAATAPTASLRIRIQQGFALFIASLWPGVGEWVARERADREREARKHQISASFVALTWAEQDWHPPEQVEPTPPSTCDGNDGGAGGPANGGHASSDV